MKKVLVAFDSTQQALRAETLLEFLEIELDTCPTPKDITAGCALSIDFPVNDFLIVKETFKRERVEIKGYYYEKNGQHFEFKGEK